MIIHMMIQAHSKIFLISLCLLFTVCHCVNKKKWKFTSCDMDNLDTCGKIVFLYGNRDIILPNNTKDMISHCAEEKSAVKCIFDWGKNCINKTFARQTLVMIMSGAAKNIRERCSPKGTKWYLNNSKCVIESANILHSCMETMNSDINSLLKNPSKNEWLASVCCLVDKWRSCYTKGAKAYCDKEGMKFLKWGTEAYISDYTDLVCNSKITYNSTRCKEFMVKLSNKTHEAPLKSILVSMYKLITSISYS